MESNPQIDRGRLLALFYEFGSWLEDLHAYYHESIAGFNVLHERLLNHQDDIKQLLGNHPYATAAYQDTCSVLYKELGYKDVSPVSISPVMKQGVLKERTCEDGKNYLLLGRHCVVSAYAYWEEYLRAEVGKALGLPTKNDVEYDFWGDMALLRNAIVHNNGIATKDMAKCKIIRCFNHGESIDLTYQRMQGIFLLMGQFRNNIHEMSLPPSEPIQVPNSYK